jgi:hypothetical protein
MPLVASMQVKTAVCDAMMMSADSTGLGQIVGELVRQPVRRTAKDDRPKIAVALEPDHFHVASRLSVSPRIMPADAGSRLA